MDVQIHRARRLLCDLARTDTPAFPVLRAGRTKPRADRTSAALRRYGRPGSFDQGRQSSDDPLARWRGRLGRRRVLQRKHGRGELWLHPSGHNCAERFPGERIGLRLRQQRRSHHDSVASRRHYRGGQRPLTREAFLLPLHESKTILAGILLPTVRVTRSESKKGKYEEVHIAPAPGNQPRCAGAPAQLASHRTNPPLEEIEQAGQQERARAAGHGLRQRNAAPYGRARVGPIAHRLALRGRRRPRSGSSFFPAHERLNPASKAPRISTACARSGVSSTESLRRRSPSSPVRAGLAPAGCECACRSRRTAHRRKPARPAAGRVRHRRRAAA